jgi:hypothetical protein
MKRLRRQNEAAKECTLNIRYRRHLICGATNMVDEYGRAKPELCLYNTGFYACAAGSEITYWLTPSISFNGPPLREPGRCICHAHVLGPRARSPRRTLNVKTHPLLKAILNFGGLCDAPFSEFCHARARYFPLGPRGGSVPVFGQPDDGRIWRLIPMTA